MAITTALLVFLGIASPAAAFIGIGIATVLVLTCSASLYGTLPTILLAVAGTVIPLVLESYGAERSWRFFSNPLTHYFTKRSLIFAFDTESGTLIFVLALSIVGSFVIARALTRRYWLRVILAGLMCGVSVLYAAAPLAAVRAGLLGAVLSAVALRYTPLRQPVHIGYMHGAATTFIIAQLLIQYRSGANAFSLVFFLLIAVLYVGLHVFPRASAPHAHN